MSITNREKAIAFVVVKSEMSIKLPPNWTEKNEKHASEKEKSERNLKEGLKNSVLIRP